jgi:hypothetical protein
VISGRTAPMRTSSMRVLSWVPGASNSGMVEFE